MDPKCKSTNEKRKRGSESPRVYSVYRTWYFSPGCLVLPVPHWVGSNWNTRPPTAKPPHQMQIALIAAYASERGQQRAPPPHLAQQLALRHRPGDHVSGGDA